jgi:hypothetical protein
MVLHPIFLGLFPLFSLLSANMAWAGFGEVLLPAGVVLSVAAALWITLWPLLPQPHKRGLVVSLFWLPFYGYSTIVDSLRALLGYREMLGVGALAAVALLAAALGLAFIAMLRRAPWDYIGATKFLNRISGLALAVALLSCAMSYARQAPSPSMEPATAMTAIPPDADALPNIYFIVCDSYPRADYLKSYFDMDNTPFLNGLRERGFYIAERSRSNYPNTMPSLASTLNLEYLDNSLAPGGWDEYYPELIPRMKDNLVVRTLRARGYEYVAIATGLFPTDMTGADRYIHPGDKPYTEYQQRLIEITPVRSIFNRMKKPHHHRLAPFVFDTLEGLRRNERPMFVFAHVLLPHLPHGYDAEGNIRLDYPPYKEGWRQMTDLVNRRLTEIVDTIQRHEPNSIIIIEGDHGPRTSWQDANTMDLLPWEGTWEEYIRDRSANLSTCYFPDRQYEGLLYPEITPVNTFRVIFNKYFGGNYEMLEDVTYLSPQGSAEIIRVDKVH